MGITRRINPNTNDKTHSPPYSYHGSRNYCDLYVDTTGVGGRFFVTAEAVAANIAKLTGIIIEKAGLDAGDVVGLGMCVSDMINNREEIVTYSNNLDWHDFTISKKVEDLTNLLVRIANDANGAALGEVKFDGVSA